VPVQVYVMLLPLMVTVNVPLTATALTVIVTTCAMFWPPPVHATVAMRSLLLLLIRPLRLFELAGQPLVLTMQFRERSSGIIDLLHQPIDLRLSLVVPSDQPLDVVRHDVQRFHEQTRQRLLAWDHVGN